MRNTAYSLLVLALTAAGAQAQQPSAWAQKIFFGVTSHDFGNVPRGAQLRHKIPMKNIYAVPLEITNVRTTCGCLTATPSARHLKPGDEGYLDLLMDGRRFNGFKSITLYVTVGPEFISTAAITVTAHSRADVVFNPGEINFGLVRQGETPTRDLDVEYAGSMDWRIIEVVKSSAAPFDVAPRESYRHSPRMLNVLQSGKVGYKISVTLKPTATPGTFREELLLRTNDPATPVLTVVVDGTVQASLSAAPDAIAFGAVKVGEKTTRRVVVRGTRPFRIVGIDGGGDGVNAEVPASAALTHLVTVSYQPTQIGELRRDLRIRSDQGSDAVTVTVTGSGTP